MWPWEPDYNQDRQLANPAFDKHPAVIVYCASASDVGTILRLCQGQLIPGLVLPMVMRSGGHSTAGYSAIDGGVILDTSRLNGVYVDPEYRRLHAGPGTQFKMFCDTLARYGFAVTTGVCPDVCVGGYMQGGGYGWNARMFGMNCDNVLEVEVMLADGSVVLANATTNSDLLYAVCGGCGNNFGVLLRVTYQVYPLKYVHGFSIAWDIATDADAANGAAALDLLQRCYMGSNLDRRLGMHVILVYQASQPDLSDSKPYLLLRVMFNGTRDEGLKALQAALETPGAMLQWEQEGTAHELNTRLLDYPYEIPQFPRGVNILPEAKQSRYIDRPLGVDNWRQLIDYIRSSAVRLNTFTTAAIEVGGGAINMLPIGTNAYIHRSTDGDLFCDVFWRDEAEKLKALDYMQGWVALLEPLSNDYVYQNYKNYSLDRWWWRYWGSAVPLLQGIKRKYDPTNFFHFPQGIGNIPPEATAPGLSDSLSPRI